MARLEENQAKGREEMMGKFSSLNASLKQIMESLAGQPVMEDPQDRGIKRKASSPKSTAGASAHKKSSRELMVWANDLEERSEDNVLFDSDVDGGARRSDSSEEEGDTGY